MEYKLSVKMKEKLKFLDTDKTPKEVAFIGWNMRVVQGACGACST
jgi:hypothetical protein